MRWLRRFPCPLDRTLFEWPATVPTVPASRSSQINSPRFCANKIGRWCGPQWMISTDRAPSDTGRAGTLRPDSGWTPSTMTSCGARRSARSVLAGRGGTARPSTTCEPTGNSSCPRSSPHPARCLSSTGCSCIATNCTPTRRADFVIENADWDNPTLRDVPYSNWGRAGERRSLGGFRSRREHNSPRVHRVRTSRSGFIPVTRR